MSANYPNNQELNNYNLNQQQTNQEMQNQNPNQGYQSYPYQTNFQQHDQSQINYSNQQQFYDPNQQYYQQQYAQNYSQFPNQQDPNYINENQQVFDQQTPYNQQNFIPQTNYQQDVQNPNYVQEYDDEEMNQDEDEDNDDDYGDDEDDDYENIDLVALAEQQRQLGLLPAQPVSSKISISFGPPSNSIVINQQKPISINIDDSQNQQNDVLTATHFQQTQDQQVISIKQDRDIEEEQKKILIQQSFDGQPPYTQQQNVTQQVQQQQQNDSTIQQFQENKTQSSKIKISFGNQNLVSHHNQMQLQIQDQQQTYYESQNNYITTQVKNQIAQVQTIETSIIQNQGQFPQPHTEMQKELNIEDQQQISQDIYQDDQNQVIEDEEQDQQIFGKDDQIMQDKVIEAQEQSIIYPEIIKEELKPIIIQLDPQQILDSQQKPDQKKSSKADKKKKRKKGKGYLTDFYSLAKTKLTIEIDSIDHRMRGQALYTFKLKSDDEESLNAKIDSLNEFKKYNLDLNIHAKQMHIISTQQILEQNDEGESIKMPILFEYPQPQNQATFLKDAYENMSKDLNTFEARQQAIYENEQQNSLLQLKTVLKIKTSKDDIRSQFPDKVKILVEYMLEKITNFGIQLNKFQQSYDQNGQTVEDDESSYYFTQDYIDSNEQWMPIIQGTKNIPQRMNLKFLAPKGYFVISSGKLVEKVSENDGMLRTLYVYNIDENEKCIPNRIGFIMAKFTNICKFKDLNQVCPAGATGVFTSQKKYECFMQNRVYEKHIINIVNYLQKLIQAQYPCSSLKLVFVPNLILRSSKKQSLDYQGGLHIFDEELLFNRNQLENRNFTYKYLASSLAFDYFGGKVYEETPEDWWLLQGLRESLGNHFKISQCGILLYRYNIMQTIESLYKKMKYGQERSPLSTQFYPHPSEQQMNDIVFQKCELIMHMIESMIDKSYYERIIRSLYEQSNPTLSQGMFHSIFKQVCGFKLKQFFQNWIVSTSCPKLVASFNYNKKNNSLDLNISQSSAMKTYFTQRCYIKNLIDMEQIFSVPSFSFKHIKSAMASQNQNIDSFFVELKRGAMRYFTGEVNVMIYLTDGAEIQTQQQKMSLKYGKSQISVNIPLQCKVKKTIQNKKKEYENMLMYDQEMHQDDEREENINNAGNNDHHMIDNMQWKFGLNDFELEDYPYGTKNLFDVKNLESPVLWIRVDPDMEFIRKVKVVQEQNNWLFQLLQEKDIIGQIESINQLYKFNSELVYEILKSVSTNENYFMKVRKIAIKRLQQMQTSQFNKYLSHEKFLIKVFNQRNFDKSIGFYKSNDFTKVLEYYIDKSILKTLSKCKEVQFELKDEVKEFLSNLQKQNQNQGQNTNPTDQNQQPGQISINVSSNQIVQQKKNTIPTRYEERFLNMSSEQITFFQLKEK